ncbi:hypothetical protein SDC9_147926 [bioreactor metagenome]|uniref:DUF5343 domain-containing protein n=1 Tax=bioreactor metagenome TaxID=1076179 RepID=A0A645EHD6_9ZZZZ
MSLPTSYMTGSFSKISTYFDTMLTAKAPDKFTIKFMSDLGFTSSNDRQFVNVLKAIGFLDDTGTPTTRYFNFLDQSKSKLMVAEGIKEAYADLFNLNTAAQKLTKAEVEGKFKTLTSGSKENSTVSYMASTFINLCAYADWSQPSMDIPATTEQTPAPEIIKKEKHSDTLKSSNQPLSSTNIASQGMFDLNYNIHIHLPATRDEGVYDALFASLAKHIPLK